MTIDFDRSFASHPKAEFWSDKNDKSPCEVFKSSNKKFWFACGDCEHSFDIQLGNVTNHNSWCPFCAKPSKRMCGLDCTTCFEKSFASHPKAEFWDYVKNEKTPVEVFKNCNKKFWFNCDDCEHSFDTTLAHVTNGGKWCPFCANRKLCELDCTRCFEKSFARHPKAEFWSDRNENKPRDVFKGSGTKFWFDCGECKHSFDTTLGNVTSHNNWCPMCKNKTEKMFLKWFKNNYTHVIKHQVKYDWCKNIRHLPFDFSVESLKLIIEIDGPQHFRQISNWQSPEITQERDEYKTQTALENGYNIVRILQEDIFKSVIGWEDELVNFILNIIDP